MKERIQNKKTDQLFYLAVMLIIVLPIVGYYTYKQVFGGATINTTITTNADLENGLVLHYTFDGKDMDWSSTTAEVLDTSGNGNNGNTNFISTSTVPGKIGQAVEFDGTSDQVDCGANSSLKPSLVTLSAWIKPGANWNQYQLITGMTQSSNWGGGYHFVSQASGPLQFSINSYVPVGGSGGVVFGSQSDTPVGTWTHVVGTYDGSYVRLYKNGELYGTPTAYSTAIDYSSTHCYMGYGGGANAYFNGAVDDVRVYSRALSAQEISRLYHLGATTHINTTIGTNSDLNDPADSGLITHYTFDGKDMDWGSTTAEVLDTSGNGRNGNATTTMSSASVVPGKISQALTFGGSGDNVVAGLSSWGTTYSVAFWMKANAYASNATIFMHGFSNSCAYSPAITLTSLTTINAALPGCAGTGSVGNATLNSGWNHVVLSVDGSTSQTLYINGASTTSNTKTSTGGGYYTLMGAYEANNNGVASGNYFNGSLDDVRIYNKALTAEEVKRLYHLGATTHINTTVDASDALSSGLVAHWTFDGKDMDWGASSAEILNHVSGGATGDAINLTNKSVRPGKLGQSLQFDEASLDYISVADSENWNFTAHDGTIAFWLRQDDLHDAKPHGIISQVNNDMNWAVYTNPGGVMNVGKAGVNAISTGSGVFATSTWSHVAISLSGSLTTIYVDGKIEATSTTAVWTDSVNPLRIGGHVYGGTNYYFNGSLDDIRVYNRALSIDEVQKLYDLGR